MQNIFLYLALLAWPLTAVPHAFLERATPGSGATLSRPPEVITIYFDSELEPFFSKLIVKDERGIQVSLGEGKIADANQRILGTRLAAATKGVYHVYWSVVSHDGHRARGNYTFTVK